MKIDPKIFKAYDIRGIYPDQINEETIEIVIKAIYTFFVRDLKKDNLSVVLGRDMRTSSPSLFEKAKNALAGLGATVVDVGLVTTPTFYFATLKYGYDAGIQISASHNPKEYNGVKFAKRVGNALVKIAKGSGMDKVAKFAFEKDFVGEKEGGKVVERKNVLNDEVEFSFAKINQSRLRPLTIVADPANAMGVLALENLFKKIPCKLIKMNFKLDGTFPSHQPDPLQFKLLKGLQARVIEEKADLGIAPDGDFDRVFFIDEKGQVIPATMITSLLADEILHSGQLEKVGVDIRYIRNASRVIKEKGSTPIVSKVGHALITRLLMEEDGIFAGESSGHFYFRDTGYAESSLRTILHVLEVVSREGKPISQILQKYSTSYESGEINFIVDDPSFSKQVMDNLLNEYSKQQGANVSRLDGIAVEFASWRFGVRASNTEPLLRLNVEGESEDLVKKKVEEIKLKIIDMGGKVHD